jgi:hypothetical protein
MKRNPKTIWTTELLNQLREAYPHQHTDIVAAQLGLTRTAVYNKAFAIGLKKTPAYLASENSGRIHRARNDPRLTATQFKPGHQTWNKGIGWRAGGRSIETQFKPGSKPHTTMPLGSYRVVDCKGNKQLEQKTSDATGANQKRWTPVARLVWERHHGPIPTGHIVIFKDPAQRTVVLEEITIDKLAMVTRGEHAKRNHPRSKNPEFARLVQLKGAINRQVNRLVKEHQQQQENRP